MARTEDKYPYYRVEAEPSHHQAAVERHLRRVEARNLVMTLDEPGVAFTIGELAFRIEHPTRFFLERNGGDEKKARRQAWAALGDYVKALVTRVEASAVPPVVLMAAHLQLPGRGETLGEALGAGSMRHLLGEGKGR